MAQWMGQFTGRTHESKIKDIECSLSKAIKALKSANESNRAAKQKTVLKLCKRLHSARHKAIKARISRISETRSLEFDSKKTQNLIEREKQLVEGGVGEILKEFKLPDLVDIDKLDT